MSRAPDWLIIISPLLPVAILLAIGYIAKRPK